MQESSRHAKLSRRPWDTNKNNLAIVDLVFFKNRTYGLWRLLLPLGLVQQPGRWVQPCNCYRKSAQAPPLLPPVSHCCTAPGLSHMTWLRTTDCPCPVPARCAQGLQWPSECPESQSSLFRNPHWFAFPTHDINNKGNNPPHNSLIQKTKGNHIFI